MRRIFAQARKELTQIVRDRMALVLALLLPLILLFLLGTALSLTVHDLPMIVQDFDDSPASRSLIESFRNSLTFRVVSWPADRPPELAFNRNNARAALIIPEHFDRDMARGASAEVQILTDATDANTAKLTQAYAGQIISKYNAQRAGTSRVPPGSQSHWIKIYGLSRELVGSLLRSPT